MIHFELFVLSHSYCRCANQSKPKDFTVRGAPYRHGGSLHVRHPLSEGERNASGNVPRRVLLQVMLSAECSFKL